VLIARLIEIIWPTILANKQSETKFTLAITSCNLPIFQWVLGVSLFSNLTGNQAICLFATAPTVINS
jgi:hypothetical protein